MSERVPLISGNWKMHKTVEETRLAVTALAQSIEGVTGVDVMLAPPFTSLTAAVEAAKDSRITVGAQNMHWEPKGAFTGEISTDMILGCGCTYVIIGHSERRQFFGETDQTVNKKVLAALEAGLNPVMCVGETQAERDAGQTEAVLNRQVKDGLANVRVKQGLELVVAYEPVWAIGTGLTATPDMAQAAHAQIRGLLESILGKDLAKRTRVLYGGSVKPGNAKELMGMPDIDGALVGGASLDPEVFSQIVKFDK